MGVEVCMNKLCKDGSSGEWKKGWSLMSGGFAKLCNKCGLAYENSVFCDVFHRHEAGWRECSNCNKPIHCGCIVSRSLFEYHDSGGIGCVSCIKISHFCPDTEKSNRFTLSTKHNASDRYAERAGKGNLLQLCRTAEVGESSRWPHAQRDGMVSCNGPKSGEVKCQFNKEDRGYLNVMKHSSPLSMITTSKNNRPTWGETKNIDELSLKISLFQQEQQSHPLLTKQMKNGATMNLEANKGLISHERVGWPHADMKGKSQLLSRYWPRITNQELEKLSGDLKSTIVPLFEKVLSPSDAGRIGRLVLPKACAEAFLPPISQSEGVPLQFQDLKGNEWTFQFRFWPNNNSRMYVLEGVTPCIQALQLNAGDTVTFSRIEPGEKFVLGFRRATNSMDTQDAAASAHSNGILTKDTNLSGGTNILNSLEKKKTRNIGPKTKRLHIRSEDSIELRLTWEEAQDFLCPPPSVKPNLVTIEDQIFEEYDEPPVFGRRTITNTCQSSASEQLSPKEKENLLRTRKVSKKRKSVEKRKSMEPDKLSSLEALASAAILGDNLAEPGESLSAGATTKHPRHRPGCSCIVCIQPPSGQGKHKPTCTCVPCETVKRRFNTYMMRRKKNKSESSEAAAFQNDQMNSRDEADTSGGASGQDTSHSSDEGSLNEGQLEVVEPNVAGQLDLNCHPNHEDMEMDTCDKTDYD
ncbi:unnamed protein product [Vicia faba]|uniref:TF-B3 domain-containing protein n=1 Tax=Vicia faba TaxID=3906 RepID=A0AAV0YJ09_VICFA|nr:unnamed protein product [Vicia faba]